MSSRASATPVPPPASAVARFRDVLRAGVVSGLTAALLCLALYGVGLLIGIDYEVATPGGFGPGAVTAVTIVVVTLAAALLGAALGALALGQRRGGTIVLVVGTVVFGVSLASPLLQPAYVSAATRLWLALMHLVTYLLVVPAVARVVSDADPPPRPR
ncbi:MAG: hypothetical protein EPO13_04950 [Actinomycetota bacterium]|nr:MAG: hypothetical protein EPO13_04950 [Actinomycetota bacterium]